MSSKRAIRRKQCKGKVRYDTQVAAQRGIGRLRRDTGSVGFYTAYRCDFCGGFHFGHTPKRIRQSISDSRQP